MELRFISEKYLSYNPALDWKKILTRNLDNLSLASKRCTQDLAARHFFTGILGRR
jgi:hypothetical protein